MRAMRIWAPGTANKPSSLLLDYLEFRSKPEHFFSQLAVVIQSPVIQAAARLAAELHSGQPRRTGEPYIVHPIATAWLLAQVGVEDETILAAALLHDVIEDCRHLVSATTLHEEHGVRLETVKIVSALTKNKELPDDLYWRQVAKHPGAIAVKLADRIHNLLTMDGVYTLAKQQAKVDETRRYVLGLQDSPVLSGSHLLPSIQTLSEAVELVCDRIAPLPAIPVLAGHSR